MTVREQVDKIIQWMKTGPYELPKNPRYMIESAIRTHAEDMRERAADECATVAREHRVSNAYPPRMDGLANECETRIRALPVK